MNVPADAFGLRPPEGVSLWWGARVIFARHWSPERARKRPGPLARWPYWLDYVGDRMQMIGGSDVERKRFAAKLDKRILPRLERECAKAYLTPPDEDRIAFDLGGYHVEASPRASYGYLYVGVWPVEKPATRPVHCPECASERGVAIPRECPHQTEVE